jgi:osmotically-inducible protein OsmY
MKLVAEHERSDSDIAQAAAAALRWNWRIADAKLQVKVENGWITRPGEVDWSYQVAHAVECIRPFVGLRGPSNRIASRPRAKPNDIGAEISAALTRQAAREAKHIGIDIQSCVVTLRGKVHSLAERDAVFGVALTARGVTEVVDELEIGLQP